MSTLPMNFFDRGESDNKAWLTSEGSKIFAASAIFQGSPPVPTWGLAVADVEFVKLPEDAWRDASTSLLLAALADKAAALRIWKSQGADVHCLPPGTKLPATLAFRAGDGSTGIVQILDVDDSEPEQPIKMRIRYRLAQGSQTKNSVSDEAIAKQSLSGHFAGESGGVEAELDFLSGDNVHLRILHEGSSGGSSQFSLDLTVGEFDGGGFALRGAFRKIPLTLAEVVVLSSTDLRLKIAANPLHLGSIPDCEIILKKVATQTNETTKRIADVATNKPVLSDEAATRKSVALTPEQHDILTELRARRLQLANSESELRELEKTPARGLAAQEGMGRELLKSQLRGGIESLREQIQVLEKQKSNMRSSTVASPSTADKSDMQSARDVLAGAEDDRVHGLSVRMRSREPSWRTDEVPLLLMDVGNVGPLRLTTSVDPRLWRLEVDGVWYRTEEKPGSNVEFDTTHPLSNLPLLLDSSWETAHENEIGTEQFAGSWLPSDFQRRRLTLAPGKHVVRVAVFALPLHAGGPNVVRAVGNVVEIETLSTTSTGAERPPSDDVGRLEGARSAVATAKGGQIAVTGAGTQIVAKRVEIATGDDKAAGVSPKSGMAASVAKPRVQFRLEATKEDANVESLPFDHGKIRVEKQVRLDEASVAKAAEGASVQGMRVIDIEFTPAGSKLMEEVTTKYVGRRLVVVFDGRVLAAPTIMSRIKDRSQISGTLTDDDVKKILSVLPSRTTAIPSTPNK